jgi:hypothetical protein
LKNILGGVNQGPRGSWLTKKQRSKISWYCLFKGARNPPEYGHFAGAYQLRDEEATRKWDSARNNQLIEFFFRPARSKCGKKNFLDLQLQLLDTMHESQLLIKSKQENVFKMKNKPDPVLLWASNLSNKIKKDTKISWDYPFHAHNNHIF